MATITVFDTIKLQLISEQDEFFLARYKDCENPDQQEAIITEWATNRMHLKPNLTMIQAKEEVREIVRS